MYAVLLEMIARQVSVVHLIVLSAAAKVVLSVHLPKGCRVPLIQPLSVVPLRLYSESRNSVRPRKSKEKSDPHNGALHSKSDV